MKILVMAKQVPKLEEFAMEGDGRLRREGIPTEMSAYCRRAVAKGVELARVTNGHCTVASFGPPAAEDILREALAWGADEAVLLSDPIFAGSDTLATSRAIAALVDREGPFDLVLVGRSSLDSETGQVGPQLAELLDLPFAWAVRSMEVDESNRSVRVQCEQDDGWRISVVALPAVLAVAERLCAPAKVAPEIWRNISPALVRRVAASELASSGPWGMSGSPTKVGVFQSLTTSRSNIRLVGPLSEQLDAALKFLSESNSVASEHPFPVISNPVHSLPSPDGPVISVLFEPGRPEFSRELLGCAADLAASVGGWVVGISTAREDPRLLWDWGADEIFEIEEGEIEEDFSLAACGWIAEREPLVMLAPASYWGREVASRIAARLGAGLTGDAIDLEMDAGRLVAWKSACGDSQRVAIVASSLLQMATVRPGVLPIPNSRAGGGVALIGSVRAHRRERVQIESAWRDDDWEKLARAQVVIGLGVGVKVEEYPLINELSSLIGAEIAGTRKVTDVGWLTRSRQIGITGRTISPRLYIAIGLSGKLNHMVGVQRAGKILAINSNQDAPVFNHCDLGLVADWRELVPLLIQRLQSEAVLSVQNQDESVL